MQPFPPEKSHLPLSQQPPSKSGGPAKPPFLKIWLEVQPPCRKGGSAHYAAYVIDSNWKTSRNVFKMNETFIIEWMNPDFFMLVHTCHVVFIFVVSYLRDNKKECAFCCQLLFSTDDFFWEQLYLYSEYQLF